ncbi:hypothetical protein B0H17DRAFT_1119766 [Mycena rosella]|uniref:Uncharacterized protein n=1 Tax=Mycena rosella TaxID=1033263 RepID=A0AAD7B089_MYCRO|nr:hypothetical protein B0H17DRAFT_1119766 [Mycena rosella]
MRGRSRGPRSSVPVPRPHSRHFFSCPPCDALPCIGALPSLSRCFATCLHPTRKWPSWTWRSARMTTHYFHFRTRSRGNSSILPFITRLAPSWNCLSIIMALRVSSSQCIATAPRFRVCRLPSKVRISLRVTALSGKSLSIHLGHHDYPIELPTLPSLRFLTLTTSMQKLHVPHAIQEAICSLAVEMPHIEVLTVVVLAELESYTSAGGDKVDRALKKLTHLCEVHFGFAAEYSDYEDMQFERSVREGLQMANEAGLLTISKRRWAWYHKYDVMGHFSR